jgi:aldehyde:ferredoxin oxidoreductase
LGYQHRFYDLPMGSHMTNEKRNTAIMDKVKRYTQHHTATPNLAQEAIERIAMTNDKDSAMPIMQIQSSETFKELFRINADGTVTGDIENASEAAKVFFESLRDLIQRNTRQPTQSDADIIANERKAIAAWLRGEVDTDYTDPEYDIGRNLADAVERGAYIQEQSK